MQLFYCCILIIFLIKALQFVRYKKNVSSVFLFNILNTDFHIFFSTPFFTLAPKGTPVKIPGFKIRYFYGLYESFFFVMFGELSNFKILFQ